jgi:serine/threonine-protein kinase RsbW
MGSCMEPAISVSVPARPEFVYLLRTVVAGVAGRLELPFDVIQDMRLAVHEASADLLSAGPTATTISLRLTPESDRLTVLIWTDADIAEWPRSVGRDQLTWRILSSLTDEAQVVRLDGAPGIRLQKGLPVRG